MKNLIYFSLALVCFPGMVWSHARLMLPPSRSSMWRLGFPTEKNFNDNQLYCGGMTIQWQKNGGKCGICGDPYNMPHPRENEAGGKYGVGIISKRYVSSQIIDVIVDVTTNHRGYFEFKLCPNNNPKKEATQECLDKYVLREAHGTGNRYYIGDKGKGNITVQLQLPRGLICSQCVFQWTYVAGNNWGKCDNGASGMGCGPQETFRGCADIAIHKNSDFPDVIPNDIDVESKHYGINTPKNVNNDNHKNSTNNKNFITYTYEVTKHTRQNANRTVLYASKEHSNHRNHHDHGNFSPEIAEGRHTSFSEHNNSSKRPTTSLSKDRNHVNLSNRRKQKKFHSRNFYYHKSVPSFRQNPFDERWEYSMSNDKWPMLSIWQMNSKRGSPRIPKNKEVLKYENNRPQSYFSESFPSLLFTDSDEDISLPQEFTLGGRRYKDFWLL